MDYYQSTTNQNQPVEPPKSSGSVWKWIFIFAVLIAAAGLVWYFYFYQPASLPAPQPAPTAEESQSVGAIGSGDTTADIINDLNQTPDDFAPTQELNSLNQDIENF